MVEKVIQKTDLDNKNFYQKSFKNIIGWSDKILDYIDEDGYSKASLSYKPYKPHWIRDSSFTALALLKSADIIKNKDFLKSCEFENKNDFKIAFQKAKEYEDYASKIIKFNIEVYNNFKPNIKNFLDSSFENLKYNVLNYNIPARVGKDRSFYKDENTDDSKYADSYSGLVQNDTVPLILISLEKKMETIGLDQYELKFLKDNSREIFDFLKKSIRVQSSNAWELRGDMQHSYDIAAIYKSMDSLVKISRRYDIGFNHYEITDLLNSERFGNPLYYMRKLFVDSEVLYACRKPFSEQPSKEDGVDMSELIIFTLFEINDEKLKTKNVEYNTINLIEKELFGGRFLAKRFKGDSYFFGGRWILSAAEKGLYLIDKGKLKEAKEILEKLEYSYNNGWYNIDDYIMNKKGEYSKNTFPEQIIYDPESPEKEDNDYFKNNKESVIQDLMWSYADVVRFNASLVESLLFKDKIRN